MTIEINCPEMEALSRQQLHSGAFASVEDVLFGALEMQSEQLGLELAKAPICEALPRGTGSRGRSPAYLALPAQTSWSSNRRPGGWPSRDWPMLPAKAIGIPTSLAAMCSCVLLHVYQYRILYRRTRLVEMVAALHGKRHVVRLLKVRES
jgi:hypothetical protein